MSEITRRSVLLECLAIQEEKLRLCSSRYDMLEARRGMEEQFMEQTLKCRCIRELIQACETEPVKKAIYQWQMECSGLAGWQRQLMAEGGPPKELAI